RHRGQPDSFDGGSVGRELFVSPRTLPGVPALLEALRHAPPQRGDGEDHQGRDPEADRDREPPQTRVSGIYPTADIVLSRPSTHFADGWRRPSWPDTIARLSPIVYLMGATRRSISPEDRIGGAAPWTTSPASVA